MKTVILLAVLIISPVLASSAFAHQVDAVGDYRIQIDWKNWPVVAGEANAIIAVSYTHLTLPTTPYV